MIIVLFQQFVLVLNPAPIPLLYRVGRLLPNAQSCRRLRLTRSKMLSVCLGGHREQRDPRFSALCTLRSQEAQGDSGIDIDDDRSMISWGEREGQSWEVLQNDSNFLIFIIIRTCRAAWACNLGEEENQDLRNHFTVHVRPCDSVSRHSAHA
jgi:hypothetical protein